MHAVLGWLERSLLAVAVILAAWCALTVVESRYYAQLPLTRPAVNHLPGDAGNGNGRQASGRLQTGALIARLEAPSVHLSASVLEGSDDSTLAKAAGHIEQTAFPGQPGNVAIAGHRDTTFRAVRKLKVGDTLMLKTEGGTFTYRIAWTKVVDPEDVYVVDPTSTPSLTLVTCYPFECVGHAPHRYIVRAELIEQSASAAGIRPGR